MSYSLRHSETFDEGVRRIGLEQIDAARVRLAAAKDEGHVVHSTRKGIKKIRALLRLARCALPSDVFEAENAFYRDVGRSLSVARDRQVMAETLDRLDSMAKGRTKTALAAVRAHLATDARVRDSDAAGADMAADIFAAVRAQLGEARHRMANLPMERHGFGAAFDGLERTYRQARRAMDHAFETRDDEAFHDFRKRVQHHWRHMALMSSAWPEYFDARSATARQLSQLLGEDHDVAVLMAHLDGPFAPRLTERQRELISICGSARQSELRHEAFTLSRRLFNESPASFRERAAFYWDCAGDDDRLASAAE
jgi:hypothetical protein